MRRAVRNQTHELKAAFRTADRQQRHRRNPRSVVQIVQRESGVLPAPEVRSILAQRGIPLTDAYWAQLWPSAVALARLLQERPELVAGRRVVEIGSGLGLASLAAATYSCDPASGSEFEVVVGTGTAR